MSIKEEITLASAKSALPVSVSGGLVFGMHISELVQWATLAFVVLQIGHLLIKYWQIWKNRNNKDEK